MKASLKVGDLVVRSEASTVLYRVTSRHPHQCLRLLPYNRSGREVWITTAGGVWVGDGSTWTKAASSG